VLTFEMLTGTTPFVDVTGTVSYRSVLQGSRALVWPQALTQEHVSSTARDFVQGLLQRRPERRLGCGGKDIRRHRWFKEVDWRGLLENKYTLLVSPDTNQPKLDTPTLHSAWSEKREENPGPLPTSDQAYAIEHFAREWVSSPL